MERFRLELVNEIESSNNGKYENRCHFSFKVMLFLKTISMFSSLHTISAMPDYPVEMPPQSKVVMGYFPQWGVVNIHGYTPFDIPVEELTHINYAFAKITNGSIDYFDEEIDTKLPIDNPYRYLEPKQFIGAFDAMNNPLSPLRLRNPSLQTLISVGGRTGSRYFSDVALSPESRQKFADSVVDFLQRHKFDGVDIDWEYPTGKGAARNVERPEDVSNFTKLLATVRAKLNRAFYEADRREYPYLLSIATSISKKKYQPLEFPQILQCVDWVNLMAYDVNAPGWSDVTGHNAPLDLIANSIEGHIVNGLPASRMVLGVPLYGYSYGGVDSSAVGSSFNPTMTPNGTIRKGMVEFSDVLAHYGDGDGYESFWDPVALVPYRFNKEQRLWISTEDVESVKEKARFAMSTGMRGVYTWDLSMDGNHLLSVLSGAVMGNTIPYDKGYHEPDSRPQHEHVNKTTMMGNISAGSTPTSIAIMTTT